MKITDSRQLPLGPDFSGHRKRKHHARPFSPLLFDYDKDLTQAERERVAGLIVNRAASMFNSHEPDRDQLTIEAGRYQSCRQRKRKYRCDHCGTKYTFHTFCHSRICETCGRIFKQRLTRQLMPLIQSVLAQRKRGYVLSSLTLTLNKARFGDRMPDRADIARLHQESARMLKLFYGKYIVKERANGKLFEPAPRWIYGRDQLTGKKKKIRRREGSQVTTRKGGKRRDYRYWKGAGAIACLEVGKDNNNLHLHAIVYGPYQDMARIREAWARITGDSSNLKLIPISERTQRDRSGKPIRVSIEHSIGHLLKYITKPPVSESYDRIADYVVMLKGSRRLKTSGIFYNRIRMAPVLSPAKQCLKCDGTLKFMCECDLSADPGAFDYFSASRDPMFKFNDYLWINPDFCHLLPVGLPS